jgi:hypothetical protein
MLVRMATTRTRCSIQLVGGPADTLYLRVILTGKNDIAYFCANLQQSVCKQYQSMKKNSKSHPASQLLKQHQELTQSDAMKVSSHVQRESGEWIINTLMIEGYSVPFKYKRKKLYRNLSGQQVNLSYYPDTEVVADMELEIMKVVRIKRS